MRRVKTDPNLVHVQLTIKTEDNVNLVQLKVRTPRSLLRTDILMLYTSVSTIAEP